MSEKKHILASSAMMVTTTEKGYQQDSFTSCCSL